MFYGLSALQNPDVLIRLTFDSQDPPVGRAVLDDGLEEPFEGWLHLLRILSQALEVRST